MIRSMRTLPFIVALVLTSALGSVATWTDADRGPGGLCTKGIRCC